MRHLSNNDFEILSKKIVQLFPSEITESYFLPPTKKRDSFDNRPGVAKGKLVDKFRNKLTFLREAGILPTRNKENELPIQEVFDTNPENQHILWLKHNRGSTDQVYHHWDASFSARRQQLLKDGGILEELRDQYPILKEPICLDLVETDFEKIFPNKSNHLIDSWESVITKLIKLRGYCVTAESDRILLDLLGAETLHDDYKHYVMLTLMASLLPNKSRHEYGRSRKQWKPTVVDSRNGIVIRAEADGSVGYLISTYRMECSTRGPRSYPRSLATISHSRQNPTPNSGLGIRFSLVCRHGWKRSGIMDIFNRDAEEKRAKGVYLKHTPSKDNMLCLDPNLIRSYGEASSAEPYQLSNASHYLISAKSLRTPSNMFIVNLAFCDFIMFFVMPIFVYNSFDEGFSAGWFACQIYAMVGSFSGIGAGMTNACIAYDRFNTITRPFDGKLSKPKAVLMIIVVWIYATPWAVLPMFEIWGRFMPEGFLTACSFDYLTRDFDTKLFVGSIFITSYVIPMSAIIYFYSQIVCKVFSHEKALREQAKKMNVESLRANQQQKNETAELRIAKAALTICFLFVASWTPYAILSLIGAFGDQSLLTPGVSMIPALACKLVSCIDPYVYAISHPKYRIELQKRLPCLGINEASDDKSTATNTSLSQSTVT